MRSQVSPESNHRFWHPQIAQVPFHLCVDAQAKGVVVRESWQDFFSIRIETNLYPELHRPLSIWPMKTYLDEMDMGFLRPQNFQYERSIPDVAIRRLDFDDGFDEAIRQWGLSNALWEKTWVKSRFLSYWEEPSKDPKRIWIAEENHTILGILIQESQRERIEMEGDLPHLDVQGSFGMYVPPEHRQKGIAHALFQRMEEDLRANWEHNGGIPVMRASGKSLERLQNHGTWMNAMCTWDDGKDHRVKEMVKTWSFLRTLSPEHRDLQARFFPQRVIVASEVGKNFDTDNPSMGK